jgi:hypothetical protein
LKTIQFANSGSFKLLTMPQSMASPEYLSLSSRSYDAGQYHSLQVNMHSYHLTPNLVSSDFSNNEDAYLMQIIHHSPFLVGLGMMLVFSLGTSPASFINDAGKFG